MFWLTLFLASNSRCQLPHNENVAYPNSFVMLFSAGSDTRRCDAAARFLLPNITLHVCVRLLQPNHIVRTACLTAHVHCKWALVLSVSIQKHMLAQVASLAASRSRDVAFTPGSGQQCSIR